MIEFYDNDMSVCAQKVRLVLVAKNLDYTRHTLDLKAGDQFKPDYLNLNSIVIQQIATIGRNLPDGQDKATGPMSMYNEQYP